MLSTRLAGDYCSALACLRLLHPGCKRRTNSGRWHRSLQAGSTAAVPGIVVPDRGLRQNLLQPRLHVGWQVFPNRAAFCSRYAWCTYVSPRKNLATRGCSRVGVELRRVWCGTAVACGQRIWILGGVQLSWQAFKSGDLNFRRTPCV